MQGKSNEALGNYPVVFGRKAKKYYVNTLKKRVNIAEGAVRSGKTVLNVFAFAEELEVAPELIHLASGVSVGAAKLIIGYNNGYGLEALYEGRYRWGVYLKNEAMFINTFENGEKIIIFTGGGKAGSEASITGITIGMWIATEINLHHKDFIREARRRMIASKHYKIFWDLNPGHSEHYFYTDFLNPYLKSAKEDDNLLQYERFTLFDNEALTQEQIDRTLADYNGVSDPFYRRDILGEHLQLEGAVYKDFNKKVTAVKEIPFTPQAWSVGIDWGYSASGTACVLLATDFVDVCVVMQERHIGERSSTDNLRIAQQFIKKVQENYNYYPEILPDNADVGACRDFKRFNPEWRIKTAYQKPPILSRIQLMHYLLSSGKFTYIAANCPDLASAIENAKWKNAKNNEREDEDDIEKDNDTLDAMEYAMIPFTKYLKAGLINRKM